MIIYLKRLKSSKFVRVKAFPMYGGIGVSAPSRLSNISRVTQLTQKSIKMKLGIHKHFNKYTNIIMVNMVVNSVVLVKQQ